MTIRTYLGKITMTLKNNSAESLTGVYKESTDIFNGATLMIPAADIGQDEDFYATVIGYEGGDVGLLVIDKDFPFPVIGSMPNVIDVISGEVIDTVTTKDGGKLEQEKKVEITKNGVTEIFPDEGYALSKVTAVVNVPTSTASKLPQVIDRTVTELTAEDLAGATKIGDHAFQNCDSLTSVMIPNGATSIGKSAFRDCDSLMSVIIGSGVTSIGEYAFYSCISLTSVTIPDNVESLSKYALRMGLFSNKATITFLRTTPPSISSDTFDASALEKIIVPKGCGDAYKSATNWAKFADYIEEATE
jgi:hypothetical protein